MDARHFITLVIILIVGAAAAMAYVALAAPKVKHNELLSFIGVHGEVRIELLKQRFGPRVHDALKQLMETGVVEMRYRQGPASESGTSRVAVYRLAKIPGLK